MAKNELSGSSKGLIVCTASNAGLYPFPIAPIYSATKHGVVGLVRSLARPLEAESIRINALAPAVIGITTILSRAGECTLTRSQPRTLHPVQSYSNQ